MTALTPPQNAAGVLLPSIPSNPASLVDIANAKDYIDRLSASRSTRSPHAATDADIGAAEAYKAAVILSYSYSEGARFQNNQAQDPPWRQATLNATIQTMNENMQKLNANMQLLNEKIQKTNGDAQQMARDVSNLRQKLDEIPVLLINGKAGMHCSLLNPTAMKDGWAPELAAPNPRTKAALTRFSRLECIASAENLGLPEMPETSHVYERQRQIGLRLGWMD